MSNKDTARELKEILITGNNFIWLVVAFVIIILAMFVLYYYKPESKEIIIPTITLLFGLLVGKRM